jgi:hypothetical protein
MTERDGGIPSAPAFLKGERIMASFTIKGKTYPLKFDMYAMEQIEEEFGGVREMYEAMRGENGKSVAKAMKSIFRILANSARNEMDLPENITGDEVAHCNIHQLSGAIAEAITAGMKSETTGGNEADDQVHDEYLEELEAKN